MKYLVPISGPFINPSEGMKDYLTKAVEYFNKINVTCSKNSGKEPHRYVTTTICGEPVYVIDPTTVTEEQACCIIYNMDILKTIDRTNNLRWQFVAHITPLGNYKNEVEDFLTEPLTKESSKFTYIFTYVNRPTSKIIYDPPLKISIYLEIKNKLI